MSTLLAPAKHEPSTGDPGVTAPLFRLTLDQYHSMIRHGIFVDEQVELLDGLLVQKMAENPPHSLATRLLRQASEAIVPSGWFVDTQEPITLLESEPEPDVTVVRGKPTDYAHSHPGPADLGLVVEVPNSSLSRDRSVKKALYEQNGIPEFWILDLSRRVVEVFTLPQFGSAAGYPQSRTFKPTDRLPVTLDGTVVGDILVNTFLPT